MTFNVWCRHCKVPCRSSAFCRACELVSMSVDSVRLVRFCLPSSDNAKNRVMRTMLDEQAQQYQNAWDAAWMRWRRDLDGCHMPDSTPMSGWLPRGCIDLSRTLDRLAHRGAMHGPVEVQPYEFEDDGIARIILGRDDRARATLLRVLNEETVDASWQWSPWSMTLMVGPTMEQFNMRAQPRRGSLRLSR